MAEERAPELIVCGWDEVFILRVGEDTVAAMDKVWSWRAEDKPELPSSLRGRFGSTDECKPVEAGRLILIASSGGAAALVERATGQALFWCAAPNAHSVEILPRNRVAVAASHADGGDRLILFDLSTPEKELFSTDLPWGHGVVWDEPRHTLWALADEDVRAYRLVDWETTRPSLERVALIPTPEAGGHDLYPIPGTGRLSITTARHAWLFDPVQRSFTPHPDLADAAGVKSIAVHPGTGRLVYQQAEHPNWWSSRLGFRHPDHSLHLPGERLYKARWRET